MNLPIQSSRLIGKKSDEVDVHGLTNEMRALLNQQVDAWVPITTTTDATVTSAWSDVVPPNSIGDFTLTAVGTTASVATVAGYRRRVVVARIGTAAVTYIGAGQDIIGADKEVDATWEVGFALDAARPSYLFAAVQGAAATTVTWRVHVKGTVTPWR